LQTVARQRKCDSLCARTMPTTKQSCVWLKGKLSLGMPDKKTSAFETITQAFKEPVSSQD
jgi:hypothetical protein